MKSNKVKYYTIRRTSICNSGYGIFECEDENKCTLIACVYTTSLSTPLNDFF
ncbi:hypothetical protein [Saccharolobus caldissimus]|uniref:Uncharacterized protein n=1 Tax=Saccharolobus caldissimus TaxID=1702097 RepID=A0AAQ4CS06_9CREN|nr:hypothetical protein [Saccharolobus caldissimus]BDB98587.1 hypothetical protein SACC_16040 [Saccharolobus caldissimus]